MINSISQQQNTIEQSNIKITQNTEIAQNLSLQTDKNATTLQQLQQSIDTQLSTVAKLLGTSIEEGTSTQDAVLQMQQDANNQSDLIDSIKSKVSSIQSEVESINDLQASMTNILLALDEDKLLYTDDDSNLTLQGVLYGTKIVVDEEETGSLIVDDVQFETTGDAAIAGQGIIETGETEVIIDTKAVESDSVVLVTPKQNMSQSLAVSEIICDDSDENCTGFKASMAEMLDAPVIFNWLVVNSKSDVVEDDVQEEDTIDDVREEITDEVVDEAIDEALDESVE
jgi:hypothetical protein